MGSSVTKGLTPNPESDTDTGSPSDDTTTQNPVTDDGDTVTSQNDDECCKMGVLNSILGRVEKLETQLQEANAKITKMEEEKNLAAEDLYMTKMRLQLLTTDFHLNKKETEES